MRALACLQEVLGAAEQATPPKFYVSTDKYVIVEVPASKYEHLIVDEFVNVKELRVPPQYLTAPDRGCVMAFRDIGWATQQFRGVRCGALTGSIKKEQAHASQAYTVIEVRVDCDAGGASGLVTKIVSKALAGTGVRCSRTTRGFSAEILLSEKTKVAEEKLRVLTARVTEIADEINKITVVEATQAFKVHR